MNSPLSPCSPSHSLPLFSLQQPPQSACALSLGSFPTRSLFSIHHGREPQRQGRPGRGVYQGVRRALALQRQGKEVGDQKKRGAIDRRSGGGGGRRRSSPQKQKARALGPRYPAAIELLFSAKAARQQSPLNYASTCSAVESPRPSRPRAFFLRSRKGLSIERRAFGEREKGFGVRSFSLSLRTLFSLGTNGSRSDILLSLSKARGLPRREQNGAPPRLVFVDGRHRSRGTAAARFARERAIIPSWISLLPWPDASLFGAAGSIMIGTDHRKQKLGEKASGRRRMRPIRRAPKKTNKRAPPLFFLLSSLLLLHSPSSFLAPPPPLLLLLHNRSSSLPGSTSSRRERTRSSPPTTLTGTTPAPRRWRARCTCAR